MVYSPYASSHYREFIQACRAFPVSELVRAIARVSAALDEPPFSKQLMNQLPPWGLAAAAKEALLHGNEYRSKRVDHMAILKLMAKFHIAMDIDESDIGEKHFATRLLTQITYEQIPYSESIYNELARSHAWLVEGLLAVETKVVTDELLEEILGGVPLRAAIGATFLLRVGAKRNSGIYDPGWLDQPNFADVLDVYPRATIEATAARLTTTIAALRNSPRPAHSREGERFSFNPLTATPFVDLGDGVPVAPATSLILRTVSPAGLYYSGIAKFGTDFANDLGLLFEYYVGRQLRLIEGAVVIPEITFGKGGGQRTVDWFVVLPGLVVLVEVKSARMTALARAGESGFTDVLERTLGRARGQLAKTVQNLEDRTSELRDIPTDRRFLALIVTAEPFYTGQAFLLDEEACSIQNETFHNIPVAVASARELESFVMHGTDIQTILLDRIESAARNGGAVHLRLDAETGPTARNPILENAWNSYSWPSEIVD